MTRLNALQFKVNGNEDKVSIQGLGNFDTRMRWFVYVMLEGLVMFGWKNIGLDFSTG